MPRWRPDVPFEATGDAPERPRPSLTERERRLAAWERYIGPHAAKGVSNLMDLVGEMSPGADIRDALASSREMMAGAKERDARRFLESVPALGAALAGVMVPGSPGVPLKYTLSELRRKLAALPEPPRAPDANPIAEALNRIDQESVKRFGAGFDRLTQEQKDAVQNAISIYLDRLPKTDIHGRVIVEAPRSEVIDVVPGRLGALVPTAKSREAVKRVEEAFPWSSTSRMNVNFRLVLAELDALGAPDIEYMRAFSTGTKTPLRKGETWRGRLVEVIKREDKRGVASDRALVPYKQAR